MLMWEGREKPQKVSYDDLLIERLKSGWVAT